MRRLPRIALSWYGSYGPEAGATLGDLLAVENLSRALTARGIEHLVLSAFPMSLCVPIISDYHHTPRLEVLVHVCGPLIPSPGLRLVLLQAKRKIAVGVSVLPHFVRFNRVFDRIVARDGLVPETFDLAPASFAGSPRLHIGNPGRQPVVGVCLRGPQAEYGGRRIFHKKADEIFGRVGTHYHGTIRRIYTVLRPENAADKIAAEFTRADIVATTRLHGALLALCAGKPVIAIDQVEGGAKVARILTRIGWPLVFRGEEVTQEDVNAAFALTLTRDFQHVVAKCRAEAVGLSLAALSASVDAIVTLAGQG